MTTLAELRRMTLKELKLLKDAPSTASAKTTIRVKHRETRLAPTFRKENAQEDPEHPLLFKRRRKPTLPRLTQERSS